MSFLGNPKKVATLGKGVWFAGVNCLLCLIDHLKFDWRVWSGEDQRTNKIKTLAYTTLLEK